MTSDRLSIRRERTIRPAPGRGIEVAYQWVVRAQPRALPPKIGHNVPITGPRVAVFPTFDAARIFAAEWADHRAAHAEPTC